jgi:hypothetical protein
LNSRSPAKHLVKALVRRGVPVHVQRSGPLREVVPTPATSMVVKVRFKTFHAAKGLEAKLVIVLHRGSVFHPMPNSMYVAITRSTARLVVFQDVKATSKEEVTELYDSVGTENVVVSAYTNVQPTRVAPPEPFDDTKKRLMAVEEMFSYIEPDVLVCLENQIQCTDPGSEGTVFDDESVYSRTFDVRTSEDGKSINVADIIMSAISLAVQYFRTRVLPAHIHRLGISTDRNVLQLYRRGLEVLQMQVPHIQDPWSIEHLYLKLQAFAMFATAIDACKYFGEKIMEITRFDFIMSGAVVRRVQQIVCQMQKYVPDTRTIFGAQKNRQVSPKMVLTSSPTLLCPGACVYNLIHRPSTEPEDFLTMALHLCTQGLEYGYVSNVYTGELRMVYLPKSEHCSFLGDTLAARDSSVADMNNEDFIQHHHIRE